MIHMTTPYVPGQLVESCATGCGHDGVFIVLYRTKENEAPSILGHGDPLAYRARRVRALPSECTAAQRVGAELYFFHTELSPLGRSGEGS